MFHIHSTKPDRASNKQVEGKIQRAFSERAPDQADRNDGDKKYQFEMSGAHHL